MSRRQLTIATVLLCSITASLFSTAECDANTTLIDHWCSTEKYQQGSSYGDEIDQGLDELTYMTYDQPNLQYTLVGQQAFGFAYCQLYLQGSETDCVVCLENCNNFLRINDCAMSVAAYVVLNDCGMRYGPQ